MIVEGRRGITGNSMAPAVDRYRHLIVTVDDVIPILHLFGRGDLYTLVEVCIVYPVRDIDSAEFLKLFRIAQFARCIKCIPDLLPVNLTAVILRQMKRNNPRGPVPRLETALQHVLRPAVNAESNG